MEKGITVDQIHLASRLLHERKIRVGFFLQFGYTGETRDDIEKTFQMVKECSPDEIGVSVSYPLPGTKFYEDVKMQMETKHNWYDSQDLDMMFQGTYSADYYRILHKIIHKQFRIWNGLELLASPRRWSSRVPRALAAAAYHAITLPRFRKELSMLERVPPRNRHTE